MYQALLLLGFLPVMSSPGFTHGARRQRCSSSRPHHPPTAWLLPWCPLSSPVLCASVAAGHIFPMDCGSSHGGIPDQGSGI